MVQMTVAYLSAEVGFESGLHTYSGGLGVLAGDHIKSAADAGVDLVGCTLLYRKGYGRQHLDSAGNQTETYAEINPHEFLCDTGVEIALPLWMLFGFFGTTGILLYAVLPTGFPPEFVGRVITSMNVLTFGGAFASQWGIGAIINLWPESAGGGYDPAGYRVAFAMMLSFQLFGLLWYGLFRRDIRI